MSRHLTDHREPSDGSRVKNFTQLDRETGAEGSHPAAQALNRRPAGRTERNARLAEFTRIDRGRTA